MKQNNTIDLRENADKIILVNTKLLAIAAAVILLLATGGLYLFSQNKSATKTSGSPTPTKAENKTSSLLDLLNLGKNQRCTFKTTVSNAVTEGVVYIAAGKMRNDFTVTTNGKKSTMYMIRNGEDNYIWGGDMEKGIKMKLSLEELSSNSKASQYVNPNQKVDYSCDSWNVDQSVFMPPSNVEFTDLSGLMPKTTSAPSTNSNSSPCDTITDAVAKTACLNALSGQ